jgi:ATP-dependent DNA ligase
MAIAHALAVLSGRDVMGEPFLKGREVLEQRLLPKLSEPIRYSLQLHASLIDLTQSVKAQGREGLVAKQAESE